MIITTTKRKVLFFIPTFPVLTETFIEGEIEKLVKRDNLDILVFALRGDPKKLSETTRGKVIYKELTLTGGILGILFGIFRFRAWLGANKLLKQKKVSIFRKCYLSIKYLGYSRLIHKLQPDLLVAHFLSEPSTLCMFASRVLSLPYGISAHAKDVTVEAELVPQKMATAKFILTCNKNAQKSLIQQSGGVGVEKAVLHYHGIDVKKYSELSGKRTKGYERPLVTSVGRLVEKKGHTYLIEASKILKERNVNHLIYIIGPGPLYKELQEQIIELGLTGWVEILGKGEGLPHEDTLEYLAKSSVGVFSGIKTVLGDEDGIPNVLLEYASMNVPIVSTDAGSATDFVENEITGLVVPQKDTYLLADAIEKLILNQSLISKVTANAFKKVSEEFNIDINAVKLENILS